MIQLAGNSPFVSVVIPCYNQGHFLEEAIESVLAQTYPSYEILLIDDGSSDNTAAIANRYSSIKYLWQSNQGLSAARNSGLRHSQGEYCLFLDADDRLLPNAIEAGIKTFMDHPECAFVFGRHQMIDQQGRQIKTPPSGAYRSGGSISYASLLVSNQIAMHGTVLYRRAVFDAVGIFNNRLPACEDYDLYLRIARQFPVASYDRLVAEYRKHDQNMSRDTLMMLRCVLSVLGFQRPYLRGNPVLEKMYRRGVRNWIYYYGREALYDVYGSVKAKKWKRAFALLTPFIQYTLRRSGRSMVASYNEVKNGVKKRWMQLVWLPLRPVEFGDLRRLVPIHCGDHLEPRWALPRYYRESFLEENSGDLQGNVLEVASSTCECSSHPGSHVTSSEESLLSDGRFSPDSFDCILIPQVAYAVSDLRAALRGIYTLLKPGGVLLACLSGLLSEETLSDRNIYFTGSSARRLFTEVFPLGDLQVRTYGNALAAVALLHGLEAGALQADELAATDPRYPILIGVRAVKPLPLADPDVR